MNENHTLITSLSFILNKYLSLIYILKINSSRISDQLTQAGPGRVCVTGTGVKVSALNLFNRVFSIYSLSVIHGYKIAGLNLFND